MVAGAAKIGVLFQVDADGLLSVSATELSTGVEAKVEVKPSYGLNEDEIKSMLQASFEHAREDIDARSLTEARVDAVRVIEAVRGALKSDAENLLSPDEIDEIGKSIHQLESVLDGADSVAIQDLTRALSLATDEFAARRMDANVKLALAGHEINEFDKGQG